MSFNVNSLDIDLTLDFLVIGTTDGDLCVYCLRTHKIINKLENLHLGIIEAIQLCSRRQYVATLGGDRSVKVLKYDHLGNLEVIFDKSIRDIGHDDFAPIHSPSQAICLHPNQPIIATRSGSSCCIELNFLTGELLSSLRAVHEDLVTVRYSVDGGYLLAGANTGEIGIVSNGQVLDIFSPEEINETIHWFEPLSSNHHSYIVATDIRRLLKIDVLVDDNKASFSYSLSQIFSDDDFEHITTHPTSGRCVATSFDRTVYEVDIQNMAIKNIAFKAPFKIRWAKFYDRTDDSKLVIQVRDGSLLFIDLNDKKLIHCFKETTDAIWTSVKLNDSIIFAGEKGYVWSLDENESLSLLLKLDINQHYIKRVCVFNGLVFFGCTNGDVYVWSQHQEAKIFVSLNEPIRDICCNPSGNLFIATEKGNLYQIIKNDDIKLIYSSSEPIWSVGISPDGKTLSFGERKGNIAIFDINKQQIIDSSFSRVPKRIRWIDNNKFLATYSSRLDLFDFTQGQWIHIESFISPNENTIEDYVIIDKYIVMITYNRRIFLADIETGVILDSLYNAEQTMKTIITIDSKKGIFLTLGRGNLIKKYKIHNEQLMPLGVISKI